MDIITYALSKKIAAHALSGVQSMSVSGQTLTINTKDSGVLTMTFPTPKDGVSVTDIDVNANNQIVFTMSDGSEIISGKIPTLKGDAGFSPTITENAGNTDKIYKLDVTTANGKFTTPNLKGADGTGGEGASTWSEISDKPFESLSTDFSVENGELKVVGGTGEENTIESISVNCSPISIDENKNVDITVPKVTNDLTDELKSSYDDAVTAKHTHDNKTVLDGIMSEKVEAWDKAEENVQSDWNETDDTADGFIKNKPTIPDITGLATETYVDNKVADYTKTVDLADVATSGSYNDLADKPTIPSLDGYAKTSEIPSKVSELENDSNYLSSIPEEYVTETELEAKGYLTEHQDISGKVDKVEGKSLISDTEITRLATVNNYDDTDIKAEIAKKADTTAIPSKVSELTNDSNYQTAEQVSSTVTTEIAKVVADAPEDFDTLKEMSDWIAGHKDDASAMNSAISDNKTAITALQTGKADKSEIPTTVAELTDSAGYAKKTDLHSHENKTVLDGITSTKVSNWDSAKTHADSAHAPSNAQENVLETVKINGTALTPSNKAVNIDLTDYAKKTDIPTTLPANGGNSDTVNNHNVESDVPVDAKFTDTVYDDTKIKYGEIAGGKNLFNGNFIKEVLEAGKNYTDVKLIKEQNSVKDIKGITFAVFGAYLKKGTYTFSYTNNAYFSLNRVAIAGTDCVLAIESIRKFYTWTQNVDGWTYFGIEGDDSETGVTDTPFSVTPNIQIEEGDTATEYEPYIPSVKMIAEEVSAQNDSLSVIGKCKNLLNPTLETTEQNGVTCTANGDGTYTLNGTASSDTIFELESYKSYTGNEKFRLVGCPSGGSESTYYLGFRPRDAEENRKDIGSGVTFNDLSTSNAYAVTIIVLNGATVTNLTFKPMLTTNLSATYDDFVPYTGDGETLTHDVAELKNDLDKIKPSVVGSDWNKSWTYTVSSTTPKMFALHWSNSTVIFCVFYGKVIPFNQPFAEEETYTANVDGNTLTVTTSETGILRTI